MYTTFRGIKVEYPYRLAAAAAKVGNDDVCKLVDHTHKIFRELQYADAQVITLREDVRRLRIENEFMLRLINDRNQLDPL